MQIAFHHNDNGFITGKVFNLAFKGFKPCKLTSLFSSVTADKLIPPVLFLADSGRGHYAAPPYAVHKLLHVLVH